MLGCGPGVFFSPRAPFDVVEQTMVTGQVKCKSKYIPQSLEPELGVHKKIRRVLVAGERKNCKTDGSRMLRRLSVSIGLSKGSGEERINDANHNINQQSG